MMRRKTNGSIRLEDRSSCLSLCYVLRETGQYATFKVVEWLLAVRNIPVTGMGHFYSTEYTISLTEVWVSISFDPSGLTVQILRAPRGKRISLVRSTWKATNFEVLVYSRHPLKPLLL